ncbi:MAG: hypothetical protein P9M14_14595 [Candidatus Alcyoniella australis]|nr:hypothetical protein [Candidatus Alcyoniella australis]
MISDSRRIAKYLCALIVCLALAPAALGSPLDLYGFGARANAMGSAFTAVADDWEAIYYNMAGMTQISGYQVSAGFMAMYPKLSMELQPAKSATRSEAQQLADLANEQEDVPLVSGYTIGAALKLHPMLAYGVGLYLPEARGVIIRFKPLDSRKPTFLMHENRSKRICILTGAAFEPLPGLSFGAGASIFLRIEGSAYVPLQLDNSNLSLDPGNPAPEPIRSGIDVELSLPVTFDPVAGIHYQPLEWLRFGASYRYNYSLSVDIDAKINMAIEEFTFDLGEIDKLVPGLFPLKADVIIDIPMLGDTPLIVPLELDGLEGEMTITVKLPIEANLFATEMWQPQQATVGAAVEPIEGLLFSFDATWFDWSEFPSPDFKLDIDELRVNLSTLPATITGRVKSITLPVVGALGPLPPVDINVPGIDAEIVMPLNIAEPLVPQLRDTIVPRVGVEYALPKLRGLWMVHEMQFKLRGGYQYIPTPLKEEQGLVNLVDNTTHVFSSGLGVTVMDFFTIDVYGQMFHLEPRRVVQQQIDDEYPFQVVKTSGDIFGGGMQVGVTF